MKKKKKKFNQSIECIEYIKYKIKLTQLIFL